MGRNIIFLDIDGVLNSMPYFDKQNHSPPDGKHHEIYDYHLQQLSQIVHTCNAQIVLSSTWRELDDILERDRLFYVFLLQAALIHSPHIPCGSI